VGGRFRSPRAVYSRSVRSHRQHRARRTRSDEGPPHRRGHQHPRDPGGEDRHPNRPPLIERIKPLLAKIKKWVDEARVKIVSLGQTSKIYPSGEKLTDAEFAAKYGAPNNWKYPGKDYAIPGTQKIVDIPPGTAVDRYGYEGGAWLSPQGTPLTARSLPPDTVPMKPHLAYEVTGDPLPAGWKIEESVVAPWFGEAGYGTQYKIIDQFGDEGTVEELIDIGYLIRK